MMIGTAALGGVGKVAQMANNGLKAVRVNLVLRGKTVPPKVRAQRRNEIRAQHQRFDRHGLGNIEFAVRACSLGESFVFSLQMATRVDKWARSAV